MNYDKCPSAYMKEGLQLYIEHGILPGSFLQAILANDFAKAATRADSPNRELLYQWAIFMLNEVPEQCWGSWEVVNNWKGTNK